MQRHWFVTLQKLSAAGRQLDTDVSRALLEDKAFGDVDVLSGLTGDVHWKVSLERKDRLFQMSGEWQGAMKRSCSRCNRSFDWEFSGETDRLFQLGAPSKDDDSDGNCEYLVAPGEINLVDVLREDVWLAWKADVICSDSCKGMCQGCGVNLNVEKCKCTEDKSDHPFAALRNLKLDG